jgi:hypothetical protein
MNSVWDAGSYLQVKVQDSNGVDIFDRYGHMLKTDPND